MTDIINVYKVPSCFIAVRVHDRQHCLKCKCKTNYSMVYDFRFKIISENKLIQKNRCIECNTIRRSFCKYKKYSQTTGYPILFPQQKMLRYVVPTWISTVVSSLVIDFDEMLTYRMDYNMAKPKLKRARLPRNTHTIVLNHTHQTRTYNTSMVTITSGRLECNNNQVHIHRQPILIPITTEIIITIGIT